LLPGCIHQLAVDVDLPLPDRVVADADRPGAPVALQMAEDRLVEVLAPVDRVHDHDVAFAGRGLTAPLNPFHERGGLLQEAERHQRVDGERGVAQASRSGGRCRRR